MKNFSKKLSFVMATAMVVTSLYAPQEATAAAKNAVVVKGSTKVVKSKNIYLTGKTVDFDAIVKGKNVKSGTWKSSNKNVATVNKNGVVKAVKAGKVTISFKTKGKKPVTIKTTVNVRVRAAKMMLTPAAVTVKEGESADVAVNYELSKKVMAAGGKATTYKLFAESSDEKVATVSVDGNNKIMVKGVAKSATPVAITVYAAQVDSLAKAKEVKIKLTEKFEIKVNGSLEAKQSGANKITVMGSDLTASKAAFVVKNSSGVVLPLKDMVKLNEAKNEAVLEGDTAQIPVGKYTLSYNNSDPVEFEVVKAVVKNIEIIPTGTAVMNADSTEAYAYYKVLNQFGEDITKSPLASKVSVSGSDGAGTNPTTKGKVVFKAPTGTKYQLNLSKVSVAVVDLDTGVNASAILTTGDKAKVWEIEYKGLWNVTTRKIVESITEEDKLMDYRLLYKAKDQYDNPFDEEFAPKANPAKPVQIQVNLISVTGVIAESVPDVITINDEKYYAYKIKNATNDKKENAERADEVTVQAIVTNNGKTSKDKFNITVANKIDTLNVGAGVLGVYENQDNSLDFTALDAHGNKVTKWESFKALNDGISMKAGNGTIKFVKKDGGKIELIYNPGNVNADDNTSITQVLTFVTKTNKFSTANITVRNARRPVTILGLASDQVKGVAIGQNLDIKADKIRFQDQYGNNMSSEDITNIAGQKYKIKVTLKNPNKSNSAEVDKVFKLDTTVGESLTPNNGEANPTSSAIVNIAAKDSKIISLVQDKDANHTASVNVKLELYHDADRVKESEDKSFDIHNVELKDMSSFNVEVPALVPAKNVEEVGDSRKGFKPSVYGYYAGEKIKLADTDFVIFGAAASPDNVYMPVQELPRDKGITTKKDKVRVIIQDGKPTEKEVEFTYGNDYRRVAKADFGSTVVTTNSAIAYDWAKLSADAALKVTLKDQYGQESKEAPYISFSDFDDKKVDVKHNGSKGATINLKEKGSEYVTIKLTFPGSSYSIEKTILLVRTN